MDTSLKVQLNGKILLFPKNKSDGMLIQISQNVVPYLLVLYLTLIVVLFYFGCWILLLFLRKMRKTGAHMPYILVTSFFFLFLGVSRVVFAWFDFIVTNFNNTTYPIYAWDWKIATAITLVGLAFFAYQLEKRPLQNKTKGIMTIIVCAFTILMIAYPVTDLPSFNIDQSFVVGPVICVVVAPFIYFYLAVRVPEYKTTGIIIGTGLILLILGELIVANFVVAFFQASGIDRGSVYIIAQILKIVGMILAGSAFTRELKHD